MTKLLSGEDLREGLGESLQQFVEEVNGPDAWIEPGKIFDVCKFLNEAKELDFNFLVSISAVDYIEYFEAVYHLLSLKHNHSVTLKTRIYERDNAELPSVSSIWLGADFQEREIWDLMGISFEGHPNMRRILTWEGFKGHPLRKDFLG